MKRISYENLESEGYLLKEDAKVLKHMPESILSWSASAMQVPPH